jgi:hypothetical protein
LQLAPGLDVSKFPTVFHDIGATTGSPPSLFVDPFNPLLYILWRGIDNSLNAAWSSNGQTVDGSTVFGAPRAISAPSLVRTAGYQLLMSWPERATQTEGVLSTLTDDTIQGLQSAAVNNYVYCLGAGPSSVIYNGEVWLAWTSNGNNPPTGAIYLGRVG